MTKWNLGLMVGVGALLEEPVAAQGGDGTLAVVVKRFHQAGVGTTVEGFCRVPFGLVERVEGGEAAFGAYRVTLVVRDSAGLALTEQSWTQRVPAHVLGVPVRVQPAAPYNWHFGSIQAIMRDPATGGLVGVADPRRGGHAEGY